MNDKNKALLLKKILPAVIIALYVIGMIMMIFANFAQGLVLWFISTAGGALYLYVKRTEEKKAADEAAIEEEEHKYQESLRKQGEQEQE